MFVPESCVDHREVVGEALTGVPIGQPLSRERTLNLDVDAFYSGIPGTRILQPIQQMRFIRSYSEPKSPIFNPLSAPQQIG